MQQLLARLQRALAGRYAVEHELGRGGMATVILGRDLKLDRRVAIKVYERDGDVVTSGERFLREIRIAAKLQHPNILPVFESGEGEGLVYYIMPYVAGASLRERLEREGPLPIGDAIRIAREVAEALDHAHRAGIVHRDIKPDNIMLADGVAVVADFGIARAIEESGGKVTDTGLAIGTPNYMSPEQAAAQPNLDGRTDLYALGCVLYEMLAGSPPFNGATAQAVMARHATDPVPPLATVRPVPTALENAVHKSLAKIPADRFATGKSMADALALAAPTTGTMALPAQRRSMLWIAMAAAVIAIVAVSWIWLPGRGVANAAEAPVTKVAVLPVIAIGDTGLRNYADGMTESIINGLVRIEGLSVQPSRRVFALRERLNDPQAAGRELGVEEVLASSLQLSGGTLRLSVQLVNVSDGLVKWTASYDGALAQVFAMQDSVGVQLTDQLRLRLTTAKRSQLVRGARTRDTTAYRLYLAANSLTTRISSLAVANEVVDLLSRAIALDSNYADAWVALAQAEWTRDFTFLGKPLSEARLTQAREINRAIELDSLNAGAYDVRGYSRWKHDWDWDGARHDFQRALAIAPGSFDVELDYAGFLASDNKLDSAAAHLRRLLAKDTSNAQVQFALGNLLYVAGRRDSALVHSLRATQLDPTQPYAYWVPMNASFDAGRLADADSAAARMERHAEGDPGVFALIATYCRRAGNPACSRRMHDKVMAMSKTRFIEHAMLAEVRLAIGDRAGALDELEAAARNHDGGLAETLLWSLTSLRSEPRFEAVRRQVFGNRPLPRPPY